MTTDLLSEIRAAQEGMTSMSRACFEDSELEDLRVIIRITFEFNYYAQSRTGKRVDQAELRYMLETVVSGVDSFIAVASAYRMLANTVPDTIRWTKVSDALLIQKFIRLFRKFASEQQFERRVRLLLDLFRIQIAFLGVCYR